MINKSIWKSPPAEWEPLSPASAHVWIADVSEARARDLWGEVLSADERERAARFRFAKDRVQYSASRGVLRVVLGRHLKLAPKELRFRYNNQGKPSLIEEQNPTKVQFNVAHSHGLALIAVTINRQMGVDIEQIRPEVATQEIAERFFAAEEVQTLLNLPADQRTAAFFQCWTRKEAFIKARGLGLSLPLNQFVVAFGPGAALALLSAKDDPQASNRWTLRDLPTPSGYAGALAVESREVELRLWNADGLLEWSSET